MDSDYETEEVFDSGAKSKPKTAEEILQDYQNLISSGPTEVCTSCGCLFFANQGHPLSPKVIEDLSKSSILEPQYKLVVSSFICKRCMIALKNNKIPPICLSRGLTFASEIIILSYFGQ